eukprot:s1013_g15.t1
MPTEIPQIILVSKAMPVGVSVTGAILAVVPSAVWLTSGLMLAGIATSAIGKKRVFSIGTFSKLIGPGTKVGWVQAHNSLLKPLTNVGFIDSGNNPVIFSSMNLLHFVESGALAKHIDAVSQDLGERCKLICQKLREVGLEVYQPKGGYFVWVKSKGKMTGRSWVT